MYVTKHADWLSVTFPKGTHFQDIFPFCDFVYIGRGLHGYQHQYRDRITGMAWQEGNPRDDMGCHLTMSGEALNMLRSNFGGTDDGIVRTCADWHAFASRIDLTINLHGGQTTVDDVYKALKQGKLKPRTNTYRFIEGKRGDVNGNTLYLGSPKSDRQFRAYNKSAELGIVDGEAWLRLELELRAVRARAAFGACASNGVAPTVTGHMADFISWSQPEYRMALQGESVEPVELPRKQTNRQRWLLGQVAQALAKEVREDYTFRQLFDNAVSGFLDEA